MELGALRDVVDQLAAEVRQAQPDGPEIVELRRQLSRLEAVVSVAAAAFDRGKEWQLGGARSASAWLAVETRAPAGECQRQVRLGRSLDHLPWTQEAWLAGDIGSAQVAVLGRLNRPATAAALARDEEMLVGHARTLRFAWFLRAAAYWEQHADPDGSEDSEEERRTRRDVYLTESISGMYLGKMTLDPISGAIVAGELHRIEKDLFEADWAAAKAALGRDPLPAELARTSAQRRADALVEMATRSASMPPGARRPAPLFSVFVGYETLHGRICELASGPVVSPGALLPWLDQAYVERAVFGLGRRVECSEQARFFTGATRRGVELRDRCCAHPYCDRPIEDCQADHIVPYSRGGPTVQENGQLLCRTHNRAKGDREQAPPDVPSQRAGASDAGWTDACPDGARPPPWDDV